MEKMLKKLALWMFGIMFVAAFIEEMYRTHPVISALVLFIGFVLIIGLELDTAGGKKIVLCVRKNAAVRLKI